MHSKIKLISAIALLTSAPLFGCALSANLTSLDAGRGAEAMASPDALSQLKFVSQAKRLFPGRTGYPSWAAGALPAACCKGLAWQDTSAFIGYADCPAAAGRLLPLLVAVPPSSCKGPLPAAEYRDQQMRPDHIRWLMPQLRKIFETEGVPQHWVWLAEVESSFDPQATSSMGAVGLFQLMPETARRFGLRTFPLDDRTQPEKNTQAAARYLKILYQRFGNWSLALAAYNAGEGRVSRAMKQYSVSSFEQLAEYLPLETQLYVPKAMAMAALREDQVKRAAYDYRPGGIFSWR